MSKHAELSPSSSHRWLNCTASIRLSKGFPDTSSSFADEGTCAHMLAERVLSSGKDAKFFIGETIVFGETGLVVDEEVAEYIQVYVDYVRREGEGKPMLFEQSLPLTSLTGEADAFGTADAVVVGVDTLTIIDLKYGRGESVDAVDNEQLMMYAAAAKLEYGLLGSFTKFKVAIVQPRLDHIDEMVFDAAKIDAFTERVRIACVNLRAGGEQYSPEESICRWCKAKAVCPALTKKVQDAVAGGFEVLDAVTEVDLSTSMALTDLVCDWASAVRAEVERRLVCGTSVEGFKLVRGRMGARSWTDAKAVEEMLKKQMRYPDAVVYKMTLESPTQLEKKLAKDHPKHWTTLQEHITRKEGSPSVAPESDERPALDVSGGFDVLTAGDEK